MKRRDFLKLSLFSIGSIALPVSFCGVSDSVKIISSNACDVICISPGKYLIVWGTSFQDTNSIVKVNKG